MRSNADKKIYRHLRIECAVVYRNVQCADKTVNTRKHGRRHLAAGATRREHKLVLEHLYDLPRVSARTSLLFEM